MNGSIPSIILGAVLQQTVANLQDVQEINQQLTIMGEGLGARLVEIFLSQVPTSCRSFENAGNGIALAMRYFLTQFSSSIKDVSSGEDGISLLSATQTVMVISIKSNPITAEMVLPRHLNSIKPDSIMCGAVQGALTTLGWATVVTFEQDTLTITKTAEIVEELAV
ncbi:Trafficking protein particle complex subunit 3 [Spironucleus salmonicida]|nr:Trafficking protein particle complex subunit 3 [Spironucleus salmonicida]|eukprot:EST43646.1 Trafficking protein particle complex subunit 3 [Spironucleus salmonicida]